MARNTPQAIKKTETHVCIAARAKSKNNSPKVMTITVEMTIGKHESPEHVRAESLKTENLVVETLRNRGYHYSEIKLFR